LDLYGRTKKSTVGRWVRAAKSIDEDVINTLKAFSKMKGAYLWDNNHFLMKSQTCEPLQLNAANMFKAVILLQGLHLDISAASFSENVCRPLKVLELWHTLTLKRFETVASDSVTLERLVFSLSSYSGLQSVLNCCNAKVPLNGTGPDNQGIPLCFLLVRELERCFAKGLPPPSTVPTEAESQMTDETEKEEQTRKAEAHQELIAAALDRHRQTWLWPQQLPMPTPWPTKQIYFI
jgi:hypothetical protein